VVFNRPRAVLLAGTAETMSLERCRGRPLFQTSHPKEISIYFNNTMRADFNALIAARHADLAGNAVIADAAQDTISSQQVSTAQLLAVQNAVHFVSIQQASTLHGAPIREPAPRFHINQLPKLPQFCRPEHSCDEQCPLLKISSGSIEADG